jgi:hypothetical protein
MLSSQYSALVVLKQLEDQDKNSLQEPTQLNHFVSYTKGRMPETKMLP